jgi:hypothetical protein
MALSLTEYNTSAAAAIAAGSKVEIAGAFFQFPADETPTGWTSIATGSTAYIALTASGTAGSQVVNAGYVSTAPTWRDDLQGWYASAASSVRIVASVYKIDTPSYYPKYILARYQVGNGLDKIKLTDYIESSSVSASSSVTIAGYPGVAVINNATVNTILFPVGTILPVRVSTVTQIESAILPRVASGFNTYFDDTYTTTSGSSLTGTWINRGLASITDKISIAQRIS